MGVFVEKNINEGLNILYIVVYYGCYLICEYILENYVFLFFLKDNFGMNFVYYVVNVG